MYVGQDNKTTAQTSSQNAARGPPEVLAKTVRSWRRGAMPRRSPRRWARRASTTRPPSAPSSPTASTPSEG
eukprot:4493706-Prymnesium_polylepis.1